MSFITPDRPAREVSIRTEHSTYEYVRVGDDLWRLAGGPTTFSTEELVEIFAEAIRGGVGA